MYGERNSMLQYNSSTKIFNFDYITKEDIKKHNSNSPWIPDHH